MELSGAFSNPRLLLEIPKLAALREKLLATPPRQRLSAVEKHCRPRTYVPVAKTITRVLEQANQPKSVKDIHAACEELLGRSVLYGSVKDWLSDNRQNGRITRVAVGRYQLNQEHDERSARPGRT